MPEEDQSLTIELYNDHSFNATADLTFSLLKSDGTSVVLTETMDDQVLPKLTACTLYKKIEIPAGTAAGSYCILCSLTYSYTKHSGDVITLTNSGKSSSFSVVALSTNKEIYAFSLAGICDCVISGTTITGSCMNETVITSAIAFFSYVGKEVKVSATVQSSGITANDFTNPVTYAVYAEDGSHTDYIVTITKVAVNPSIILISASPDILNTGNIVYLGEAINYTLKVKNNGAGAYAGTEGCVVELAFRKSLTSYGMTPCPINVPIAAGASVYLYGSWIIPYIFDWGDVTTPQIYNVDFILNTSISRLVELRKKVAITRTLVFNNKLGVFSGIRTSESPFYVSLNNDFYSVYRDEFELRQFFLQNVNDSCTEFGSDYPIEWSLSFYVMAGTEEVFFKNIQIEFGKIGGGLAYLDSIEYTTAQQKVEQNPFYSSSYVSWKPVYKDDKWHLPVKFEYSASAIIKNRKLKGTYLLVTFRGSNTDPIYIRSILTRIAKTYI